MKNKDFGKIIRKFTIIASIVEYFGEVVWFGCSLHDYIEYKDFLDFHFIESEFTVFAQRGLLGIFFSLICAIATTIFFFAFYGFGQIVSDVHTLSKK